MATAVKAGELEVAPDIRLASRLETLADSFQKDIDAKRAPRREGTPKQRKEAMSARLDADDMERAQLALRALARAHFTGTCPPALVDVKTKSEVLSLMRHAHVSNNYYHVGDSGRYSDTSTRGIALQKLAEDFASPEYRAEREAKDREGRITEKLVAIKNSRPPGYFPTPRGVAEKMLALAKPTSKDRILEPSAGTGELALEIRRVAPKAKLTLVEAASALADVLALRFIDHVVCTDFLSWSLGAEARHGFDCIVMNPPFERGQDIEHVRAAYRLLAPGGRLVSVMSAGPFFRSGAHDRNFREWLLEVGAEVTDLPEGSFVPSGTNVATKLVFIAK